MRVFLELHNEQRIRLAMDSEEIYFAVVYGKIVGTGSIRGSEICWLFILPEYQDRGFGNQLVDLLEMKIFQCHPVAHVDASFPVARIYFRRGYRIVSFEKIETDDGDFLCYYIMEKKVRQLYLHPWKRWISANETGGISPAG